MLSDEATLAFVSVSVASAAATAVVKVAKSWLEHNAKRRIKIVNEHGQSIDIQGYSQEKASELLKQSGHLSIRPESES